MLDVMLGVSPSAYRFGKMVEYVAKHAEKELREKKNPKKVLDVDTSTNDKEATK